MAFITRTTDTDDSGAGLDGTVHNNSWLQAIFSAIENAFISRSTITTTGNQTAINASIVRWLYCNNASLLTIQGMTAGTEGQRVFIVSTGAGQVDIANESGSATAANRITNGVTGTISLSAGSGHAALTYDATASRWRVIQHEQGAWITPTFSGANYTGNGSMSWTVGSGDVTTQAYYLRGRTLTVAWYLVTTTVGGTPSNVLQLTNSLWGGFTAAKTVLIPMVYSDNGAGNTHGIAQVTASGTLIQLFNNSATSWAAASDTTNQLGQITFEVL